MAETPPQNQPQEQKPPITSPGVAGTGATTNGNGQKPVFTLAATPKTPEGEAASFLKNLMNRESGADTENTALPPEQKPLPANGNGKGDGNAFTQLFGKSESPSQKVSQSAPTPTEKSAVSPTAGQAGIFATKAPLLQRKFDEFREKKTIHNLKTICAALFLFIAVGMGYLLHELQTNFVPFGETTAQRYAEKVKALKTVQANGNEIRLRIALLHIRRVNLLGDQFMEDLGVVNSSKKTANQKLAAQARLGENREAIKQSFQIIGNAVRPPLSVEIPGGPDIDQLAAEQTFEDHLKEILEEKKKMIKNDPTELRRIDTLMRFVKNRSFRGLFKGVNISSLDDATIEDLLVKIQDQSTDDISIIVQLKKQRKSWSEILDNIDAVTRTVDKVYGRGLFDQVGGIQYSGYELNAESSTISLTGLVKTEDTKTFTLMVNLVQAFEKSPYFKDVEMREFSKAKASEKGGYAGSIRLSFKIQGQAEQDPRDEIFNTSLITPAL